MFGIEDPGIYMAYIAAVGCLVFALWFGITRWNKGEEEDHSKKKSKKRGS